MIYHIRSDLLGHVFVGLCTEPTPNKSVDNIFEESPRRSRPKESEFAWKFGRTGITTGLNNLSGRTVGLSVDRVWQ